MDVHSSQPWSALWRFFLTRLDHLDVVLSPWDMGGSNIQWPEDWASVHITAKELLPVVIAASLWGHTWKHKRVRFTSDNMAVIALLKSCTSKDGLLMHLLRYCSP